MYVCVIFNYKCLQENINFNIKTYEIETNLLFESQIGFFDKFLLNKKNIAQDFNEILTRQQKIHKKSIFLFTDYIIIHLLH